MGFGYHILNYETRKTGLMTVLFLRITTQRFAHSQGTQIHFSDPLQTVQDFWKPRNPLISYSFQWMGIIEFTIWKGFLRLKSLKQQVVHVLQERGPSK